MGTKRWRLAELLEAASVRVNCRIPEVTVSQVTDDSRTVEEGAIFVAVRGMGADGHRFMPQAIQRGAKVVLMEEDLPVPDSVVKLRVASTRSILGPLAHAFHGVSSHRIKITGVTGTKGKTTVTWLIHHLLESAAVSCGLIGTVCYRLGREERPSDNTTPGAVQLQVFLEQMEARGLQACAMEVSSHALDQNRTDGIRWACGVFTNFAPEHLDYHQTLERYLEAKLRLFQSLPSEATAVINRDDSAWERVRQATSARVLTYGLREGADLTGRALRASLDGMECVLTTPQGAFQVKTRLIGLHNLENLLAALGAVIASGVSVKRVLDAIPAFAGVPGRLQRIDCGQSFPVFVDYAHTDGALGRVLEQLRSLTPRRICTVFGCGGDRDQSKRSRMGRVAAELSDRVIITSDNPRSENPAKIARQILEGTQGVSAPCQVILDRREAIQAALESADEDWLVLIAGKGHEGIQIFADRTVPFDDRAIVRELLERNRIVPDCTV